jgi:hypothetical protein
VTLSLARSLLLADAVTPEALAEALFVSATRGTSLVRALLATGAIDPPRLEQHLERSNAPYVRHVAPLLPLVRELPKGLCERLLALPVRRDPLTGAVDVAVVDASDAQPVEEVAHWLKTPVRMVRTSLAALDAALQRTTSLTMMSIRSLAPPIWMPSPSEPPSDVANTPPYGLPEPSAGVEDPSVSADEIDPVWGPEIPFVLTRRTSMPPGIAPSVEPVTVRGPFGSPIVDSWHPVAERTPDLAPILDQIRRALDRDATLELVVAGARTVALRAAVFAVRRRALVGWTCSPEFADRTALRLLHLPAMGTVLAPAIDHEGACLVRLPADAMHAPLLGVMKTPSFTDVALVAIRVDAKPVALVLADGLQDPQVAAQRLKEIALVAGETIAELLRRRRK